MELYRSVLDGLALPFFVLNRDRQCLFVSQAFCQLYSLANAADGWLPVEQFWPDVKCADLNVPELACELRFARGEVFAVKLGISSLEGGRHLVQVLASLSRSETLRSFHAQRLETLGMLAGGVAHDFNNMLTGILGHVTYLKTILPGKGPHVESLMAIEEGARKATSFTQQILNFSKLDTADRSVEVNLCELVTHTCGLLRGAISPQFKLEQSVPGTPLSVLANEGKLAQVIVNLVINARDALQPGGRIRVSLDEVEDLAGVRELLGTSDLPCARYVRLCVADTGLGMAPEVLARAFEPYFSTKKDKGTGLGLATVAAIVRLFGGAINIDSQLGYGTTASVYLPVVEADLDRQATAPRNEARPRLETGSEHILVIDDEYAVRNVLSISLQHLGYRVAMACSGGEALEKFGSREAPVDLVILDMLMPQLSGEQVFFKLKQLDPKVRVLLISGYASEEAVKNILAHGGLDFIQKPFTIEELAKRVRKCLDGGASAGAVL